MIYFMSDFHGSIKFSGLKKYIDTAKDDDLLILLGDIGLHFEDSEDNRIFDEQFLSIKKNIAFIDGNHENFKFINSFPNEEWNGGIVHRLTPNIVHLKRGNVYTINEKTFFVFGGCKSSPKWKELGLWYPGEEPNEDELRLAHDNLKKYNYNVDYILTHKYEQTPIRGTVCEKLRELTNYIEDNVKYKKWYSGHWHNDSIYDEKHTVVYDYLRPID